MKKNKNRKKCFLASRKKEIVEEFKVNKEKYMK